MITLYFSIYIDIFVKDIKRIDDHLKDQLSRHEVPRMPWRDQGLMVIGEGARDVARHFIQVYSSFSVF